MLFCLVSWFLYIPDVLQLLQRSTCELCTSCPIPAQCKTLSLAILAQVVTSLYVQVWKTYVHGLQQKPSGCAGMGIYQKRTLPEQGFQSLGCFKVPAFFVQSFLKKRTPLLLISSPLHVLPNVLRFEYMAKNSFLGEFFFFIHSLDNVFIHQRQEHNLMCVLEQSAKESHPKYHYMLSVGRHFPYHL